MEEQERKINNLITSTKNYKNDIIILFQELQSSTPSGVEKSISFELLSNDTKKALTKVIKEIKREMQVLNSNFNSKMTKLENAISNYPTLSIENLASDNSDRFRNENEQADRECSICFTDYDEQSRIRVHKACGGDLCSVCVALTDRCPFCRLNH
eukprot:Pgem_evm2s2743